MIPGGLPAMGSRGHLVAGPKLKGRFRALGVCSMFLVLVGFKQLGGLDDAAAAAAAAAGGGGAHRLMLDPQNATHATQSGGEAECLVSSITTASSAGGTVWGDRCAYAHAQSDDDTGGCAFSSHVFSSTYLELYYCELPASDVVASGTMLCILGLLFMILGSTAEDYFCPALASLSEMLSLQPRVAGVTLLALGNGAPDVFSIISSVKADQVSMAVGEVTGAGNFVTTAVVGGVCIVTSDGLKARGMFLRDVCMLIVSTSLLLAVMVDGKIMQTEAIMFLVLYVLYVAMVVMGSRVPPLLKRERGQWSANRANGRTGSRKRRDVDINLTESPRAGQAGEWAGLGQGLLGAEGGDGGSAAAATAADDDDDDDENDGAEGETREERDSHSYMLPKLGEISMRSKLFNRSSVTPTASLIQSSNFSGGGGGGAGAALGLGPALRHSWQTASMGGAGAIGGGVGLATGFGQEPQRRGLQRSRSLKNKGWLKYRVKSKLDLAHEWSDKSVRTRTSKQWQWRCLALPCLANRAGPAGLQPASDLN
eukprot:SAG22_NODE_224_length_14744_cov_7.467668_3_plen_538_part_00